MKSWVISTQNAILLYCSILFIENLTFPRLPFHFLSDCPPNPNIKKEKIRKVSLYVFSLFLCTLSKRYLLRLAAPFFPNNMEGSKRTTTRFDHLCSSTKKIAKRQKKRYSLMIESLLSSNTSNYFKFIVTPTRRKNLWSPSQKWNTIHNFWKTKDCRQHALVNYTKWALKVGSLLVLRVQRLE